MSLINKMLQELDKRHAVDNAGKPAAPGDAKALAQHLRPVAAKRDFGEAFWRVMAGLMVVVVGWIGWLLWEITPRPVVTELAFQARGQIRSEVPAAMAKTDAPATPQAVPAAAPAPAPQGDKPIDAVTTAPQAGLPPQTDTPVDVSKSKDPVKVDMLRLATEITTPIPARRPRAIPAKTETGADAVAAAEVRAATRSEARAAKKAAAVAPTDAKTLAAAPDAPTPPASKLSLQVAPPKSSPADGRIDKRSNPSPRERADAEFRRATTFVNQGRIAEAMESLNATLAIDPGHEAARQTAVGLLLENKRVDDAQHLLQDGLALNPSQTGFAMLLARILVERGDLNGALGTLQRHGAGAAANADYLAFSAAILQRLGRHKEATDIYQSALRLQPGSGVWWMGLGISLQAQKQPVEAVEAFRRARSAGTLTPELIAFVDQRIKQLQ